MWRHLNRLLFWSIFSSVTCRKAVLDCEAMKTNEFPSPCLDSKTNVVMKGQNVSMFCSHKNKSLQITYSLFRHKTHLGTQNGKGEPAIFNLSITETHESGPYKCKAQVCSCSKYSRDFNFTIVDPVTAPVLNITVIQTETDRHITLHCLSVNGSLPINYTFFEKHIAISPAISKYDRESAEFKLTRKNPGEEEEYRCEAKNRLPDYAAYSQTVTMPSTGKAMRNNVPRDCGDTAVEVGIYANIHEKQAKEGSVPEVGSRPCVSTAQDEAEHSQELQYATPVFWEVAPRQQDFLTVWRPESYCCDCCVVASATAASHPEMSPPWRRALPLRTLASQPQPFAFQTPAWAPHWRKRLTSLIPGIRDGES
ncbi:PREDICTED: allergin-1 isoform X4 [Rhinopithecus bieti]|uniref:allergin-1 isoform X4 n=1 Tax=Rhinopithecus bieti TaxID=61621 RepID=UPI00083C857B|nr:PREDICTED: allergin-1 isoform X4 [Rhinopithecus bieti]